MGPRNSIHKFPPPPRWYGILVAPLIILHLILLLPPITLAKQGVRDGASRSVDMRVEFEVPEGVPVGTFVGTIPTKSSFSYRFNENLEYFMINGTTGEIRTKKIIDRESLAHPQFDIVVLSSQPTYPIEVRIIIKDVNDCAPSFPEPQVSLSFPESAIEGTRVFLDTATDEDSQENGVSTKYEILDGNGDGHFRLVVTTNPSGEAPFLHLETTGKLDREKKGFYWLNISAQDDGTPPRFGFLAVNVSINDVNDCQPIFTRSQYYATLNETVEVGEVLLQVSATDSDEGENARVSYYLSENEEQFTIESETGIIRTSKYPLDCPKNCSPGQKSCPKSCVFTVFARDHGTPRQDGRAYVTVTVVESNHPPVIKFRYFPPTANTASVLESAPNASVVGAISVIDMDDGPNGETKVEIIGGNELNHFILETTTSFHLVRTNAILDREKVPVYNLTVTAQDNGNPPCSSTAYLVIEVNTDKEPEISFAKTEYSAILREFAPIGSYVASISVTEESTKQKSQVIYSIVSGNEKQWFQIDQRTGLLVTREKLDREQQGTVRLKISARNGGTYPKWAHAQIKITILDENDETPQFTNDQIEISLAEDVTPGTEITTVNAVDHDQGTNGTITYTLSKQTELAYPNQFQVGSATGKLITKAKLDRETLSNYEIQVVAKDQGIPVLSSTATINLKVKDVNDNAPSFSPLEYFFVVSNERGVGESVGHVSAMDKDLGNNGKIIYKLVSLSTSTFSVEEKTGKIMLKESLKATSNKFQLQISAIDGGGKTSENNAIVNVFVVNSDKRTLKFAKDQYEFNITEDYGSKVASSTPRRIDKVEVMVRNEDVNYFIIEGDPNGIFQIDSRTGLITSIKLIDREERASYTITILAISGDKHGTCRVNINVNDLNDRVPTWDFSVLDITIPKNAPIGEEIVVMKATDLDEGKNARLSYSFISNPFNYFSIDKNTGLILLSKPLHEVDTSEITLQIQVFDSGEPPLTSRRNLLIHLQEVNQYSPIFAQFSYETSILESVPVNTKFFTLEAKDKDTGMNGQVNYYIKDGNSADKFGIFPDGNLYVKSPLDREEMDYFSLTIMAKDNGVPPRSSIATFVIHIIDENDIPPKFMNNTFTFSILENEPAGTYVGKVVASDGDIGRNAELTYQFASSQTDFMIDYKSGFIKTMRTFDREQLVQSTGQTFLTFDVIVNDNGATKLTDKAQVIVHIIDVNDEKPNFSQDHYQVQVPEDSSIGASIVRVSAVDLDDQVNGDVLYSIIKGNEGNKFQIDETTGHITLRQSLDREVKDKYELSIMAQDMSDISPLSSVANVTIAVLDVNDCVPEFQSPKNRLSDEPNSSLSNDKLQVIETTPVNTELIQFIATDADLSVNGEVTYFLTAGNRHDTFRLNSKTGILYLNKPLDYERYTKYTLTITASDLGTPRLSTNIDLEIEVQDYNDCIPQFPSTSVVRQIQEGVSLKTPIVTVTAEDSDSGENGRVKYSIRHQSPPGHHFGIDQNTGTIHTLLPIDREFADTFRLTIVAQDQANPPSLRLSSEKLVTVIVEDVNDCEPKFTSLNSALLKANSEAQKEIMVISAIDLDSGPNGLVTYDLMNGDTSLFELNRITGALRLKHKAINVQPRYQLTVRATDEAIQSQRKFSDLNIMIIGVSEESSVSGLKFEKEQYKTSVYENEPIGFSILNVNAMGDTNLESESGSVEYYITNITSPEGNLQNRLFDIDVKRGIFSTAAILDREMGVWTFHVEIYAVLVSSRRLYTASTKIVVEVLDKNDSPPVWPQPEGVELTISESAPVGQEIATLTAIDEDITGRIFYSIANGDEGKFMLDSNSGVLKIVDALDRESQEEWKLSVRASDGEQYSDIRVTIMVTDTNDNAPAWNQSAYSFDIEEDAKEGHVIGTLRAIDLDTGVNARVTYSILSDWGDDMFTLNPNSGVVTLAGKLDYETAQHYIFVVQAQDTGVPSLSSTTTVYLNVLDLNDNPPVFDNFASPVEIFEDVQIGYAVTTVSATDLDSGPNGKISYSITSGNSDEAFVIAENGTIYTAKALDRETTTSYTLIIEARDQAPINQLSSTTQLSIILKDVNDDVPEFVSSDTVYVPENTPVNSVLLVVKAIDRDDGRNGYVEYILHNEKSTFSLGLVDGLLRVIGNIDRENASNYTLKITAKDRGEPSQSSTQNLFVQVKDKNDHGPKFDSHQYTASVPENASIGSNVLQVRAFDEDEGLNSQIRYSIIAGDPNRDFSIGDDSGVLRVARVLNYERKRAYTLIVQAEDLGQEGRYDTATVTIIILDVNDRSPIFLDSPYIAFVRENIVELPQPVLRVHAYNADSLAKNMQVRYMLKEGDRDAFRVNGTSGEITVHRSLDRERQAEYLLTIVAMDTGTPRLTGTGTVQIFVSDQNDCDPTFEQDQYELLVHENVPVGTSISRVQANDKDEGDNAVITYRIQSSSSVPFEIDSNSGEIRSKGMLDREVEETYRFNVVATDSSRIFKRSSTAEVTISLLDENDNFPKFRQSSYSVKVPSNIHSGNYVFGVTATDADIGVNGEIRYFLAGPDADKFQINETTGIIKAIPALLKSGKANFAINVRAVDSSPKEPLSSSAAISISLMNMNNFPKITAAKQEFTFLENVSNVLVTTVEGSAAPMRVSTTSRSRRFQYSIGGGNIGNVFEIGRRSGELRISTLGLDHEIETNYELWVEVSDEDEPEFRSGIPILVNVKDVNDNTPIFEQKHYIVSIPEEEHAPKLLTTVKAHDKDSGAFGSVRYYLSGETFKKYSKIFEMMPDTGEIFTKVKLDREEQSEYVLKIEAVDLGDPPRTGTATVTVNVEDINDNPMKFTRLFSVNVTENAPIGTFVIQVTSMDKDIGDNAKCTYSFRDENNSHFKIEPNSGNVTVIGPLDREVQDEYLLKVSAVDGSWKAETLLTITVEDVNDVAPEFELKTYTFNIPENDHSVAFVGQVSAIDRDKRGPNSLVTYSLKHPSEHFTIDPVSGELFSKKPMVYHRLSPENEHTLIVIAADSGKPPLSSEVTVSINVVTANNHPPKFKRKNFFSPVPHDMAIGSKIMQLQASDRDDYGLNAEIEFLKIGGNGSDIFDIDKKSGAVLLVTGVSPFLSKSFLLHVRAIDKGTPPMSDDAQLILTVTGPNQHSPIFASPNHRVIVPENEVVGTMIITLSARDDDSGPNGRIRYNISRGNEEERFTINEDTGAVSINKELDFDTKPEYLLKIGAIDMGFIPRSTEAELTIMLTDINDNPPYFEEKVYHAFIKENAVLRTPVFTLPGKDKDSPKNSIIRYAIVGGSGKHVFSVDPVSGVITSTQVFDYEEQKSFVIDVMANNADTSLHGTCKVEVHVLGVNEFVPRFVQPVFHFSVSESAQIGGVVGSIQATDEDDGDDGIVYYIFVGSSNDMGFTIHPTTGEISVARRLDRESQARIVLTAIAKNQGSIKGNDTDEAQIVITVQDGNDPPVFENQEYLAEISEDTQPGTSILMVSATDSDVRPNNNRFSYEILSQGVNGSFTIDPTTGVIYTAGILDRETYPVYKLIVGAVDTGTPPAVGKAVVTINLMDVNDNPPVLKNSSKTGEILENEPPNTKVMSLQAEDPDSPRNGEPFTFTLVGGNDASKFRVDQTGRVFSTTSFDRELTPELTFVVEISDSGTPKQKSRQEVIIKVGDKNDSPSEPRNAELLIFMRPSATRSEKIASVKPLDPDVIGRYNCRLTAGNGIFGIPRDCDLFLQKLPSDRRQSFSIVANDGFHADVSYTFQSEFVFMNESFVENSVIIRAIGVDPSTLLHHSYRRFVSWLKSIFHSEVLLYSLTSESKGTNIALAVRSSTRLLAAPDVSKVLESRRSEIERLLEAPVTINFSPCYSDSVCLNGGTCSHSFHLRSEQVSVDSPHLILSSPKLQIEMSCLCTSEFTGDRCQHRKEPCSPNPCQGGGTCIKQAFDFSCTCPSGRQGKRCEIEKSDVCKVNPCLNGGTCKENQHDRLYFCLCRPGFLGDLCQTATNICKPNPCLNGGECISPVGHVSGFPKCKCKAHYFGRYCEKSAVGFGTESFMSFPALEANTNDIAITFSTNKRNALLAYDFGEQIGGRSDFIALQLLDGRPTLSYGGATTEITTITVNKIVTDERWYRIIATRNSKVVSLYVSECDEGGDSCKECHPGQTSCYASGTGQSGTLNFNSVPLLIGGVKEIEAVLERPGQIQATDFVGCVHSIAVNGRLLNISNPIESRSITQQCQRVRNVCEKSYEKCGSGKCIDLWDSHACNCNSVIASNCHEAFVPYSFGTGSFVEFKLGEKYKRSQFLTRKRLWSPQRSKRSIGTKTLSLNFRTIQGDAIILYAASDQDYTLVEIINGELQLTSKVGLNRITRLKKSGTFVADGNWHIMNLIRENTELRFEVDNRIVGQEFESNSIHDLLDPYLTELSLGGTLDGVVTNRVLNGFAGCITNFTINDENIPLNGSGDLFETIIAHGKLTRGCNSAIAGASAAPDPLSIGVTLVIVFFVFLFISILASFIVFRMRRREKNPHPHGKGIAKPSSTGQSPGDVVRSHMGEDESSEALRNFVRNSKKTVPNNTCYQKPDIIERATVSSPHLMSNNNSPINNSLMTSSHGISMDPEVPDMPEHYDLENASSIAPSDIDIVYHYKGFRDNLGVGGRKSSPFRHNHVFTDSHTSSGGLRRHSPLSNVLKTTPLARLSPSSELSQQITPRILTLQDISGKPLQSALLATQKDVMSQSERSLNISQSSSRSSIVNTCSSPGTNRKRRRMYGRGGSNDSRMNIGLTAEEIERLNSSRYKNNSSLVSTLDDLSSESENPRKRNLSNLLDHKSDPRGGGGGDPRQRQRPRDTSSEEEESGNDSFSCSEFDYDKRFSPSSSSHHRHPHHPHMMYPHPPPGPKPPNNEEGEGSFHGSLSTLVASDDDLAYINSLNQPPRPSGTGTPMRWEYLLNWGPNFPNFSGVFKDIAQLPDLPPTSSSSNPPLHLNNNSNNNSHSNSSTLIPNNSNNSINNNNHARRPNPDEEYV